MMAVQQARKSTQEGAQILDSREQIQTRSLVIRDPFKKRLMCDRGTWFQHWVFLERCLDFSDTGSPRWRGGASEAGPSSQILSTIRFQSWKN